MKKTTLLILAAALPLVATAATAAEQPAITLECIQRDNAAERLKEVHGLKFLVQATTKTTASGATVEEVADRLKALGAGTDERPCIELRYTQHDAAK